MRPVDQALPATLLSLAAAAAALCTLPLLGPLFADPDWWTGPAAATVAAAAVGTAAQWVRLPATATPVLQLVAVVVAVTARYAPGTALLGAVPTPATVRLLSQLVVSGVLDIRANVIPVPATEGIVLLLSLLLSVLTVAAHLMAVTLRVPGVAGAALLSLAAVPLTVHPEGVDGTAFAVAAGGFLLMFAADSAARALAWGPRTARGEGPGARGRTAAAAGLWGLGAAGTAAVCVVLALLLPALVPGLTGGSVYSLVEQLRAGGQTVTTVDPLTSLRGSLTSGGDRRVLDYRTGDPTPEYLRTHVLDSFDGETWTMSPVQASPDHLLDGVIPRPPGSSGASSGELVTTEITVSTEVRGMDFLPLPYPSSDVRVDGEWYVDPDTLMVFSPAGDASGLTYTVTSAASVPDGEALRSAGSTGRLRVDQRYLDLPPLPGEVEQLAERVTARAETSFDQALALQDWFTGGDFTYDLDPPQVPSGADPLVHFLRDSRTGYCQHFASAMAVMARYLGIPARVAVGYTAGENVGTDRWTVRQGDAHAWPELYFPGYGWLRFEPTPGEGQPNASAPAYTAPAPDPTPSREPQATAAPEEESASPEQAPSPASPTASAEAEQPEESPAADRGGRDGGSAHAAVVAAASAGAAVLLAVPALLRRLVRALRWRRVRDASGAARAAWAELRDDVVDLGLEWNAALSPRAVERSLASGGLPEGPAREALHRIVAAEEAVRYSPRPPAVTAVGLAEDCRTVRRALAAACGLPVRVRAAVLPRSLWAVPGVVMRVGRGGRRAPHA